jgi:hypothetical protein
MSNVSENVFSGAEGFQAEEVKMEFDGKSMTGRFSNNNLISLASIKMNEENLRSLYMNKPMTMKVSFRGRKINETNIIYGSCFRNFPKNYFIFG